MATFRPALLAMLLVACTAGAYESLGRDNPAVGEHGDAGRGPTDAGYDARAVSTPDTAPDMPEGSRSDGGVVGPGYPCEPGTYSGPFQTTAIVIGDASLSGSFGTVTVVLQVLPSEGIGGQLRYGVVQGSSLSGTDDFGSQLSAELVGQFDCPSRVLALTLRNGTYAPWGGLFDASSVLAGSLSGVYDPTLAPPALSMGSIQLVVDPASTMGMWSASRIP